MEIIERLHTDSAYKRLVRCLCDCGTSFICRENSINTGNTKSCGCRKIRVNQEATHGDARRGQETSEHRTYRAMLARCRNPRNQKYKDYGGRGISVCDRWTASYQNFLDDMGRKPQELTVWIALT